MGTGPDIQWCERRSKVSLQFSIQDSHAYVFTYRRAAAIVIVCLHALKLKPDVHTKILSSVTFCRTHAYRSWGFMFFVTLLQVGDRNPLRLWKASVEVEAPPSVVLNRVLRERHLWDEDFLQWKVVESLDKQTEVYQYVLNSMAPHPVRDFVVLR